MAPHSPRSDRRSGGSSDPAKALLRLAGISLLALSFIGAGSGPAQAREPARAAVDCAPPPPLPQPVAGAPPTVVAWRDCADTPEMIRLIGGRFVMGEQGSTGTLYERPLREVDVREFSIGKFEVSFDQWDQCHRTGGCLNPADDEGWGRGSRPVINVSWVDAQQYVHWLSARTGRSYRLPTEAEWEYAARAGSQSRYSWGDGSEWVCTHANVLDLTGFAAYPNWVWRTGCDDGHAQTAPVGSFLPNRWDLHDMNGNVWEWVQDCWHSDYSGAPSDSSPWISGGDCGKRVNRGGGWGNNPRSMRSASRDADDAQGYSNAMGFRVARSPNRVADAVARPEETGRSADRSDNPASRPSVSPPFAATAP